MISFFENNNSTEYYITMEPSTDSYFFEKQMDSLFSNYDVICEEYSLDDSTAIYIKIYLSDPVNQRKLLTNIINNRNYMVYVVGQSPASGYKIAIEAYHIKPHKDKLYKNISDYSISFKHGNYTTHFGEIYVDKATSILDSFSQTTHIFKTFQTKIEENHCTLLDNIERVWFYVRDIDNNYRGFVDSRNVFFAENGLNNSTHYYASTGIEGNHWVSSNLVLMNYIFTENLSADQFHYMKAPDSLCPASDYNVSFERGTKVIYGDCSHYYISGTASIDNKGDILFENDVLKQISRVFHNINDLLTNSGASLSDLKIITVYLRDFGDYNLTKDYIENRFHGAFPYVILKAPVCRPGWLIEIEAIAINNDSDKSFNVFF